MLAVLDVYTPLNEIDWRVKCEGRSERVRQCVETGSGGTLGLSYAEETVVGSYQRGLRPDS